MPPTNIKIVKGEERKLYLKSLRKSIPQGLSLDENYNKD
jgi:hypothetical protein